MNVLCKAYTAGGPVVILERSKARLWDGVEDYWAAVKAERHGLVQVRTLSDGVSPVVVFHQECNGNFHVLYGEDQLAVLSEEYAEEGHEIERVVPTIEASRRFPDVFRLDGFGGAVVAFDAAVPGDRVTLRRVGGRKDSQAG